MKMVDLYATDPVKAEAREEIYRFSDKLLPRDRSQAWATYLAAENDLETKLLDRLGFSRQNRIILEGNPSKVKGVEQANPGVRVLSMMTHDFFAQEARNYPPFWYVGLDYECQLNDEVREDIRTIASKELLIDGGILYTNVVGSREQGKIQTSYLVSALWEFFPTKTLPKQGSIISNRFFEGLDLSEAYKSARVRVLREIETGDSFTKENISEVEIQKRTFRLLLEDIPESSLSTIRDIGIRKMLRSSLCRIPDIHFVDYKIPSCLSFVKKKLGRDVSEYEYKFFPLQGTSVSFKPLKDVVEHVPDIREHFRSSFKSNDQFENALIWNSNNSINYYKAGGLEIIPVLIENSDSNGFSVSSSLNLFYISNKNTKMFLDIMQVRKINPAAKKALEKVIQQDFFVAYGIDKPYLTLGHDMSDVDMSVRAVARYLKSETRRNIRRVTDRLEFLEILDQLHFQGKLPSERIFLGTAYKPSLSSEKARKCVIAGMNDEQIKERYQVGERGLRKIAALRACKTMGILKVPQTKAPIIKKQNENNNQKKYKMKNLCIQVI